MYPFDKNLRIILGVVARRKNANDFTGNRTTVIECTVNNVTGLIQLHSQIWLLQTGFEQFLHSSSESVLITKKALDYSSSVRNYNI
jgi:hypothetical protein